MHWLPPAGHLQKPDALIWFVMAVQVVVVVTACVLATFAAVDAFHADCRKRRSALPEPHFPLIWIVVILIGAVSNLVGHVRVAHAAAPL